MSWRRRSRSEWASARRSICPQASIRSPVRWSSSPVTIEDVDADAESVARTIALRKLTARACTRYEVEQALQVKNVPQDAIDAVLDRLEEVGLINDTSFAVDWVTSRQQRQHLSRRVLRRELQAKGVEPSEIDGALDHVNLDTELSSARHLVERK